MTRYRVPGLSVAICRSGEILHAAGYGWANIEVRAAATAETVYQTASVGKQFTAALILLMTERRLIRLDDPIGPRFGPERAAWQTITVRHLLTHTSGLSDDGLGRLNLRLDYTDEELVEAIASAPIGSEPGTAWSYSNAGYVLLGILIARITGRFYGDLLREWIFAPLDMMTARVISEDEIIPNRAAGYRLKDGVLLNQEYVSPSLNRTADGGLYVTVLDLAKWDRALYAGTIFSPESRDAMWRPVTLAGGSTYPYGFGWSVGSSPYGRFVDHDGEWQGFSTHIVRYLDNGLSLMILSNLSEAPVSELAQEVAIVTAAPSPL